MNLISEYDQRQLKRMQACLSSYDKHQIALNSLVGSLEFLLSAMESVDEEWESKFLEEVTTLETINAIQIIDEAEEKLDYDPKESAKQVSDAITKLNELIQSELKKD